MALVLFRDEHETDDGPAVTIICYQCNAPMGVVTLPEIKHMVCQPGPAHVCFDCENTRCQKCQADDKLIYTDLQSGDRFCGDCALGARIAVSACHV